MIAPLQADDLKSNADLTADVLVTAGGAWASRAAVVTLIPTLPLLARGTTTLGRYITLYFRRCHPSAGVSSDDGGKQSDLQSSRLTPTRRNGSPEARESDRSTPP